MKDAILAINFTRNDMWNLIPIGSSTIDLDEKVVLQEHIRLLTKAKENLLGYLDK